MDFGAAATDAVYILVTNPIDVLTKIATDVAGVAPRGVHAMILGEHGDSAFPLWSNATLGGSPIREWVDESDAKIFDDAMLADLANRAVLSAYSIIAGKGATNYAIGLAGVRLVEAILRDEHMVTPISTVLRDYDDVDGIALSVPCILGAGGAQRVLRVPMDRRERDAFQRSGAAIRTVLEQIGQL